MSNPQSAPIETPVIEAARGISESCPLFDIRDSNERQVGWPAGAIAISVDDLLQRCKQVQEGSVPSGWVMCAEGVRSLEAVQMLREHGFEGFSSIVGGFRGWRSAGLPWKQS